MNKAKKIHFIGICGVAMSALALTFKKAGWKVTGSDVGIYPPISDYLKNNGVDYYTGWHPDLMCKNGEPDLVVVGNVAGSTNPEWLYTQEHKLEYKSYPELIAKYFVKKNSIVCAGTYGKTSTSALLSWILTQAGMEPSYMFGGLTINDFPSAMLPPPPSSPAGYAGQARPFVMKDGDTDEWSVLEGDEYKTARWDNRPKFAHYSPTHLLLTAVEWDHADVYPTEEAYFRVFDELVKSVPKTGLIVASEKISDLRFKISDCVRYGQNENNNYRYFDIKATGNGIEFKITHNSEILNLQSSIIGDYMAENITGAFAMAHQIGIDPEKIIKAVSEFKGLKRRLEKRFEGKITVFDDIAHSPAKAESTLNTLGKIWKNCPPLTKGRCPKGTEGSRVVAVFEPNTGNRQPEAIPSYDNKFNAADLVIIPELTRIKQDQTKSPPLEGEDLMKIISKTHPNVKFIPDDEKLIDLIIREAKAGDVVVFLGSHGFRGMIEALTTKLK